MKKKKLIAAFLSLSAYALSASGMNPYLPLWEYIPDGEPYVFEDPDNPGKQRVYIYGSHDVIETDYCGRDQVVWSAPVDDLENWRYDGVILKVDHDRDGHPLNEGGAGDVLFAPDVCLVTAHDGTKTYYLYPNDQHGGRQGLVAKSDRPDGPFRVCNWSKDRADSTDGVLRFDPAVFADDDGRVYGYWGFEESFQAELDPATMATVKPGTEVKVRPISGYGEEGEFRFFEASSIRKIKDKYVFIYSRITAPGENGRDEASNYTLAYAYSDAPLGPWTYGGTIIDGRGLTTYADGKVRPTAHPNGNTHGSICQIGDQWYVFYHRQCGLDEFSRQAMVAPITVDVTEGKNGKVEISQAEYTSEGFETNGLNPFRLYPAGIASHYTGPREPIHDWPNKIFFGSYVQPGRYYGSPATASPEVGLTVNPVVNNTPGSIVGYKYYNFDLIDPAKPLTLDLNLLPAGIEGTIDVLVGDIADEKSMTKVGTFSLGYVDHPIPTTLTAEITGIAGLKGKQPVYLKFGSDKTDKSLADLYWLQFRQ